MDQSDWQNKIKELVREFESHDEPEQKKLAAITQQAHDNHRQRKKSAKNLHELLDYLRLCIKYQCLDLEATRRENEYLKKMLDSNRGNS
jgi:hypothetical protein